MTARDLTGDADTSADRRLASLHLRLGALLLARAELESLAARELLGPAGLADLAEARWRTGELAQAAEAAAAHLVAGGDQPVARVILAEAEAANGHTAESRAHVAALRATPGDALVAIFAGMPQRAIWPSEVALAGSSGRAPATGESPPEAGSKPRGRAGRGRADQRSPSRSASQTLPEPADLVPQALEDMRSGDPERMVVGLARLGLALRLDPNLAPAVIDALSRRREPAALLVRGDAYRILGRLLESEAAYAAAAAALDRPAPKGR